MTALSVHQEYNLLSHQHMSLPNCRHLPLHLTKCCLPTVTGPPLLITEDVPVSMTSVPGRPQHWVPNCKGHGASAEDAFLASRPHIPKHAAYLDPCTCAPRHSAPVASAARTHSGFSSPEMWSNLRTSQEHRWAQVKWILGARPGPCADGTQKSFRPWTRLQQEA